MALYIVKTDGTEQVRHVPLKFTDKDIKDISYIQADGDELDFIKSTFYCTNSIYTIPVNRNGRVLKWYGDIAKTILGNL